jgi:hypothetical protein
MLGGLQPAGAQPTNPLEDDRQYQLTRKRIEDLPELSKPGVQLPGPDFNFPEQNLDYQFQDLGFRPPVQPPRLDRGPAPRPRWEQLLTRHAKLGLGRYLTPLVQLYAANGSQGREPRFGWSGEYRHFSTPNGHLADRDASFGDNRLRASGHYYLDNHTLGARARFQHYKLNYYGDSSLAGRDEWPDSASQRYTRFELLMNAARNYDPDAFRYDIGLRLRHFGAKTDNQEFHFTLLPKLGYNFTDNWGAEFDGRMTISGVQRPSFEDSRQRFFLDLPPVVTYQQGRLSAKAGLRFATYNNPDSNLTVVAPIAEANYRLLPDSALTAFARIDGGMDYNQRFGMVQENPYLAQSAVVQPTQERINIELGAKGGLGPVSYNLRGYYRNADRQPVYFTPPTDGPSPELPQRALGTPQGYFQILYENDFESLGGVIEVNYDHAEKVRAGAQLEFATYTLPTLEHFYHTSNLRGQLYGGYRFADKFSAYAALEFIGERPVGRTPQGQVLEEPFYPGLSLKLEYFISDRFSVFAEGNNLFNSEYVRWNSYQERPLDFRLGGTVSF